MGVWLLGGHQWRLSRGEQLDDLSLLCSRKALHESRQCWLLLLLTCWLKLRLELGCRLGTRYP